LQFSPPFVASPNPSAIATSSQIPNLTYVLSQLTQAREKATLPPQSLAAHFRTMFQNGTPAIPAAIHWHLCRRMY
jgi:hypothetical protein